MTQQIGPEGIGTVTLDANGNGTAKVGPLSARETWYPQAARVSVASNLKEAQCSIYAGDHPIDGYFRDATFTGSSGDITSKISSDVLRNGQFIWAVWTGGDAGKQARLQVLGTRDVNG